MGTQLPEEEGILVKQSFHYVPVSTKQGANRTPLDDDAS